MLIILRDTKYWLSLETVSVDNLERYQVLVIFRDSEC